ncbi:MAG: hypothetical protein Q7T93_16680 [Methylobacterium sp.]|uniref:hypothetical protein n=1 Tax=Methylobacterium sp. TaxID=409 RepID=UPI0027236F87|nr:hypothetical protein [Methylobacterium sp.]MDO9428454.1 hypothetical protein [Methylobacterium sp.]
MIWYLKVGGPMLLVGMVVAGGMTAWVHPEWFPALGGLLTESAGSRILNNL